ncbi:MAG TPA: hypothetical protein VJ883_12430 [Woeseiaceae bacterium]|nr:hypothetical protein [Woeseiaceae bacterium]
MTSTIARMAAAMALVVAIAMTITVAAPLAAGPWFATAALAQESGTPEGEDDAEGPAANGDDGSPTTGGDGADGEGATGDADDGLTEEEERLAEIVGADEQGASGDYEQEEDDDFVPTQEVSSDQSVNFPVDI